MMQRNKNQGKEQIEKCKKTDLIRNLGMRQTHLAILALGPNVGTYIVDQVYIKRYKKYLHHHQFTQSIPKSFRVESAKRIKFHRVQPCYNFNFIPTTCTSSSNAILVWKDFENFSTFIDSIEPLQTYVIATYLDLVHFLISWVVFRKEEGLKPTTCWANM